MLCFRFWELLVPHLEMNGTPTFFVKLYFAIYLPYIHIMYMYYIYMYTHIICVYTCLHMHVHTGFIPKENNSVTLRRVWESSDIVLKLNNSVNAW